MNFLKWMSVVAVLCLIAPAACPEDKPDYAKLIVGKWEVTKAPPGTVPEGATVEFTKDGKMKASLNGENTDAIEGTYSLDGAKLKTKIGDKENDPLSITKISQTEMNVKDKDGKEVVLKRTK